MFCFKNYSSKWWKKWRDSIESVTSFEAHFNDDSLQKGTHALSLIMRLRVHGKLYFDGCKITARSDIFLWDIDHEIDFF